jgi:hypothetical protein
MEGRRQPMEANEVVLVNEVDLGDDTTNHSIPMELVTVEMHQTNQ